MKVIIELNNTVSIESHADEKLVSIKIIHENIDCTFHDVSIDDLKAALRKMTTK